MACLVLQEIGYRQFLCYLKVFLKWSNLFLAQIKVRKWSDHICMNRGESARHINSRDFDIVTLIFVMVKNCSLFNYYT